MNSPRKGSRELMAGHRVHPAVDIHPRVGADEVAAEERSVDVARVDLGPGIEHPVEVQLPSRSS